MRGTDVGEVWESESARVAVRLVNTTDQQLYLTHIGGNCNCTQVSPSTAQLAPRGEVEVNLTYDLSERTPPDFGKLVSQFQVVLSVEVNGRPQQPIVLTGTCRSHLATDTTLLHFGESNVRGRTPVPRWLTVTTGPDVAAVRFASSSPVLVLGSPEKCATGWRATITPDHCRIASDFEATVTVEALNGAGAVVGTARVGVDGTVRTPEDGGADAP